MHLYENLKVALARERERKQHLCYKVNNSVTTINGYKELVRNPKFICQHCGRGAAKKENLCRPVPL